MPVFINLENVKTKTARVLRMLYFFPASPLSDARRVDTVGQLHSFASEVLNPSEVTCMYKYTEGDVVFILLFWPQPHHVIKKKQGDVFFFFILHLAKH